MQRYAQNTMVSSEKSRAEIESTLARFGASAFAYATKHSEAVIRFQAEGRVILFRLELPDRLAPEYTNRTHGGKVRPDKLPEAEAFQKWEMACRQKWRELALLIKAKLVGTQGGISVFEDEFMAHIVMPDGKTVSQHMRPQIENAYKSGKVSLALEFK